MNDLAAFRGLEHTNFFDDDVGFTVLLQSLLSDAASAPIMRSLNDCGNLVGGPWNELAERGSSPECLPRIVKYDRLGNPLERVDFGPFVPRLRREVAEFGVLSMASNEIHKFGLVYLLAHNGEASVTCGLSCTDGLVRAIQAVGSNTLRETYLPALLSADTPFAGAQFVTEQSSGSDVGSITASAAPGPDGTWLISGEKWFCSNPDEFFLVAARTPGAAAGTAGIGAFLIPRTLPEGRPNGLSLLRLKNKLGTRSLPTAEISFDRAIGFSIGPPEHGFKTLINYAINTSRVHNAVNACGFLHRAFLEARNYARQRVAFGEPLISYPLIREALVSMLESLWRCRMLTFRLIAILDRNGLAPADPSQAMWQRFLINLAKHRSSAEVTAQVREAIAILGGNGIVEDFSILPRLLRDSLVIETWEGPHNTLCLQIARDAARSDLMDRWRREVSVSLERWPAWFLALTRNRIDQALREVDDAATVERLKDARWVATHSRRLVDRLGSLLELAWLGEFAADRFDRDAAPALLTALARFHLLPSDRLFSHPVLAAVEEHAGDIIDEAPLMTDVGQL